MQTIETKKGTLKFKNPMNLEQFGESLDLYERLIKLVSGDVHKTVNFSDYTDWLATTDFVEVSN